jgi:D-alanyl-D-alanine dipeptidase
VSHLKRIPILECGEPLLDFLEACPRLVLDKPQFDYRRETLIRKNVVAKLCQAVELLPSGIQMAVLEGWRAPVIQQRMYRTMWNKFQSKHPAWSDAALRRQTNKFVAPMSSQVPPPHTTGGALDLSLLDRDGNALDMISPYAANDSKGFPMDAPGLSDVARSNRALLAGVLNSVGLTNYPSEYWHFSYGDQGWAYRGSHAHAIYGSISPDGWEADPSDLGETPLVVIAGIHGRATPKS